MQIINQTRNTLLAQNAVVADTELKRIKGLLGRSNLSPGEGLILDPCNSIHTFFMRFAIDVLFVNKNHEVIKALSCLRPFRITKIYFPAAFTIELPAGTLASTSTQEGDQLQIKNIPPLA